MEESTIIETSSDKTCADGRAKKRESLSVSSSSSASSLRICRVERFLKDKSRFVQLTPTLPKDESNRYHVVEQAGPYHSVWIRVRKSIPPRENNVAQSCIRRHALAKAVYVAVPQTLLTGCSVLISEILALGFRFHRYHPETDELIWYKWIAKSKDYVPSYATSIEGGGVLILSPDETKVLLVKERGRWGRCGGATDAGESCLHAALREACEETTVEIDTSFEPLFVGSVNQPKSRDGRINDHFMLFVAKAKSEDVRVVDEVSAVRFFDIDALIALLDTAEKHKKRPTAPARKEDEDNADGSSRSGTYIRPELALENGESVSWFEVRSLREYRSGRYRRVLAVKTGKPLPMNVV